MSHSPAKRKPNATLRWVLMLAGVILVFGGVFAIKAFFAKQTNNFFDNMPQPAVAVSSYVAKTSAGPRTVKRSAPSSRSTARMSPPKPAA